MRCTSSKAAPVIDTVVAGLQVIRLGVASSADESTYENSPLDRDEDVAVGAAMLALFATSAIYGYVTTGQCADVQEKQTRAAHERELHRRQMQYGYPQPSPYPYPPGPYYAPPGPYYAPPGPYYAPPGSYPPPHTEPPPAAAPPAPGDATQPAPDAGVSAADAG